MLDAGDRRDSRSACWDVIGFACAGSFDDRVGNVHRDSDDDIDSGDDNAVVGREVRVVAGVV